VIGDLCLESDSNIKRGKDTWSCISSCTLAPLSKFGHGESCLSWHMENRKMMKNAIIAILILVDLEATSQCLCDFRASGIKALDNFDQISVNYWNDSCVRYIDCYKDSTVFKRYGFYESGELELMVNFDSKGACHGNTMQFYESGMVLWIANYNHGQVKRWEVFFEDGTTKSIQVENVFHEYDERGILRTIITYQGHSPKEVWKFGPEGLLISYEKFHRGRKYRLLKYDCKGRPIKLCKRELLLGSEKCRNTWLRLPMSFSKRDSFNLRYSFLNHL
jgi:hypothetical protein